MLHFLDHLISEYGYGVVTLVIGFESMGVPLPGESLLIGTAIYASATGKLSIHAVVAAAAIGAVLGDNAGFAIGRSLGLRVLARYGRYVGLNERRMALGRALFKLHGAKLVFFGRFVAILRTFAALLAGANGMEWRRFLVANAAGGVVWTALYGYGAYALGRAAQRLTGPIGIVTGVLAVIAIGAAFLWIRRREGALMQEAERVSAEERS